MKAWMILVAGLMVVGGSIGYTLHSNARDEAAKAALHAKYYVLSYDDSVRTFQKLAEQWADLCKPGDKKCAQKIAEIRSQAEDAYKTRQKFEAEYVAACRKCAPAAECERDRRDLERPITQTSKDWTPCVK